MFQFRQFQLLILFSVLSILFLFLFQQVSGKSNYDATDTRMLKLPVSDKRNIDQIATFVQRSFPDDEARARAVFFWITQNFEYDIDNINKKYYTNDRQLLNDILKSGKGVCSHFAVLFSALSNQAGIKSHVINGYTKQNGTFDDLTHAWVASFIDGKWQIIDPTWGTGHLEYGKFVRRLDNRFFLIKPEESIKTHCPFDPMWQLLTYPVSYQNFDKGDYSVVNTRNKWNFNDSIAAYEKTDTLNYQKKLLQRIQINGISSRVVQNKVQEINSGLLRYKKNNSILKLNEVIQNLNATVEALNELTEYYNRQFTQIKKDNLLIFKIAGAENLLNQSKTGISKIEYFDPVIQQSVNEISEKIKSTEAQLLFYKQFVEKYIATPKFFRKSLFYKQLL